MEGAIQQAIIYAIIGTVAIAFLLGKLRLVEVVLFLLPFRSIAYEVGLSITLAQFILVPGLLLLLIRRPASITLPVSYLFYLFSAIVFTVIVTVFFIPEFIEVRGGNFLREEGRFITQLVYLLVFSFGLLVFLTNSLKTYIQLRSALQVFLLAQQVLVVIGLIQFIGIITVGIDITPLAAGTANERTAAAEIMGFQFARVCALGGEPKGLAATLSVGLTIIVLAQKFGLKLLKNQTVWIFLFVLTIFLTLSSGGFILLALLPLLVLAIDGVKLRVGRVLKNKSVLLSLFLLLGIGFVFREPLYAVIDTRILQRAEIVEGIGEDFDATIIAFLSDQPEWLWFGAGNGNIHNLATAYILEEYRWFMTGDTIFVAKSGWLKLVSENGIIGFSLFLLFFVSLIYRLNNRFSAGKQARHLLYTVLIVLVFFLARGNYVLEELYFVSALAIVFLRLDRNQRLPVYA